jgi:prepilin-type processing-associated H-X9-DG protein
MCQQRSFDHFVGDGEQSQKMRVMTATPAQEGRETRTYECACGHSERINVAFMDGAATASQVSTRDQFVYENDCSLTFATGSYTRLSIVRTTKNRADPLQPSVRDAMLAAVPKRAGTLRLCSFEASPCGLGRLRC